MNLSEAREIAKTIMSGLRIDEVNFRDFYKSENPAVGIWPKDKGKFRRLGIPDEVEEVANAAYRQAERSGLHWREVLVMWFGDVPRRSGGVVGSPNTWVIRDANDGMRVSKWVDKYVVYSVASDEERAEDGVEGYWGLRQPTRGTSYFGISDGKQRAIEHVKRMFTSSGGSHAPSSLSMGQGFHG